MTIEELKAKVNEALYNYQHHNCISSGYDVMRYSKLDYVTVHDDYKEAFATEVMEWYPRNISYLILRMAKEGKLVNAM